MVSSPIWLVVLFCYSPHTDIRQDTILSIKRRLYYRSFEHNRSAQSASGNRPDGAWELIGSGFLEYVGRIRETP